MNKPVDNRRLTSVVMPLKNLSKIIIMLGIGATFVVSASENNVDDHRTSLRAFDYLNELRRQAGMFVLRSDPKLKQAAYNHAKYCALNNMGGHYEQKGFEGYTGFDHVARTISVGYPSRSTGENVSTHVGNGSYKESVDGLMSAIYHRFGFLNLEYDEVGVGKIDNGHFSSFVYNLGNTKKEKLCSKHSLVQSGKYYTSVCSDKNLRVSASDFEKATETIQKNNPSVVLWPAANSSDIPPVFFEESPDPLPEHSVSGYPVSIEFNPVYFGGEIPIVKKFKLIDVETDEAVEIIKRIDKASDTHKKFTDYQHAIFPLDRLKWSSKYRVEVEYSVAEANKSMEWTFTTRELGLPIHTIIDSNPVINGQRESSFVIYMPPKHNDDAEMAYSTKYRGLSLLDIQLIDGNTLQVKTKGRGEAEISFHGTIIKIII